MRVLKRRYSRDSIAVSWLSCHEADGLPVHAIAPQAISPPFNNVGRSDEETRSALLHEAETAVVPFTAFGYPEGSGWVRYSVGAVGLDDIDASLAKTRAWLTSVTR